MTITSTATGRRPPEETTVDAVSTFDVDVNVGGAVGCAVSPSGRRL